MYSKLEETEPHSGFGFKVLIFTVQDFHVYFQHFERAIIFTALTYVDFYSYANISLRSYANIKLNTLKQSLFCMSTLILQFILAFKCFLFDTVKLFLPQQKYTHHFNFKEQRPPIRVRTTHTTKHP